MISANLKEIPNVRNILLLVLGEIEQSINNQCNLQQMNLFSSAFKGDFIESTSCGSCCDITRSFEKFTDISIPYTEDFFASLAQSLKSSILEEQNCSKCNNLTMMNKFNGITRV